MDRNGPTVSDVARAFAEASEPPAIIPVEGVRLAQAARVAVRHGSSIVVAGGGDGTVSAVASVLAGTSSRLGVLPLGTLNHFAKDLGIPLALDAAAPTTT